jgi:hypothetical protein
MQKSSLYIVPEMISLPKARDKLNAADDNLRNGTCGIAQQAATEGEVALLEQLAEPAGLRRVGREPTEHAVPSPVLDIETLPPLRETHLPFLSALSPCFAEPVLVK